ncbi:MAG: GFA family protein, partial [Desulfarculaceae bacterium]|jgi:hypothetical protein
MTASNEKPAATGGCLCGAVRYEIHGPIRDVVNCHCSKCRRFHGNVGAYTRVSRKDLVLTKDEGLKWFRSTTDETPNVHRGFCSECGSSLFWDPRDMDSLAVSAGSLDEPIGLKTLGHIWLSQAGDYYSLSDGLEKFSQGWGSEPMP